MNLKRIWISALAVYVTLFLYDFLVHHYLLAGIYPHLWRPESEMTRYIGYMITGQIFYSVFFVVIFRKGFEAGKSAIPQGIKFGILIALFLAPLNSFTWYAILPIPFEVAGYWLIAKVIQNILLGLIVGLTYRAS